MSAPSLFDPAPEPEFVDATPLGDVREIFCTSDYATIIFEHGSMRITPGAFFALSRTLSRKLSP